MDRFFSFASFLFFLKKEKKGVKFLTVYMSKKNLVEKNFIRPSRFVPAVSSCAPGTGGQVNYFLNAKPKAKIVRRRSASSTSAVCFAKISQAVLNGKFDRQETVYRISLNRPTENLTENINRLKPASPSGLIFYLILLEIFFSTTIRGFGNPLFEIVKRLLKAVKASLVFLNRNPKPRG